jgi:hypothetical protein
MPALAKISPFHTDTDDDEYGDDPTHVYHDQSECGYGQRVKRDGNDVAGYGVGRRQCKECVRLS